MTHELILTSVSQGLAPDSRGFCAVAQDRPIPRYVQMRLETLCDYQHLFPPDSEPSPRQPVIYSHLIFPGKDTTWHALSKVCDAGLDFQSQPNRLAHHVALENHEFVPEGPAWLLALPGFHLDRWQTPTVRFTHGRPLPTLTAPPPLTRRQRIARERRWLDPAKMNPNPDQTDPTPEAVQKAFLENEEQVVIAKPPSSPCPTWREVLGDEGWGGVLAETIRTGQEVVLLFRPGQNLLPLFFEALSILPPSYFWRGTFSTCYLHLSEHVTCHWKGVPVGSPQAARLLQDRNLLVIDLTKPMGAAPVGPYVEFARTGIDGTLPSDETEESLFSDTDSATKPYGEDSAPVQVSEAVTPSPPIVIPAEEEFPQTGESTSVPPIPPIIMESGPKIRSRRPKPEGLLGKFLNMKSQHQFYLLYGTTFLLVLLLLVLVMDQMLDFGLIRWFQGTRPAPQVAAAPKKPTPGPAGGPAPKKAKPAEPNPNRPDPVVVREERARKRQEQRDRQKAIQQQKRDLLIQARTLRADYDRQKQLNLKALDQFLMDHRLPRYLSMPIPTVKGTVVDPPKPKVFPELASLYHFGLALTLEYQPLLDIPNIHVKTEKQKRTRILTLEIPEEAGGEGSEPTKLGATVEDGEANAEKPPEDDLEVPDTDHFEWIVSAVENETRLETPMFHLKLTREGLEISWMLEGMTTQHLYDTLTAALGFLRVSVEDETNMSKIQSIAMFEPKTEKAIMVAERFADPERPEFDIFMPFAVQPWKSLFETPVAPFDFLLEVTVSPDTVSMVEAEDSETASPSRFFGLFETEIQSSKPGQGGAVQFEPIEIAIEGRVGPERIVWTDRYMDRAKELNKELEQSRQDLKQLEDALDKMKSQSFTGAPNSSELRRERNELNSKKNQLSARQKQVEDILRKLPEAHDKLIKNQELRFDFAVYLVPVGAKPVVDVSADEEGDAEIGGTPVVEQVAGIKTADSDRVRLRSEESLLILRTIREPKKIVKKEEPEPATE